MSANAFRAQGKRPHHGRSASESEGSTLPNEIATASPNSVTQKPASSFVFPSKSPEELSDDQVEGESVREVAQKASPIKNFNVKSLRKDYAYSRPPFQAPVDQNLSPQGLRNPDHSTPASFATLKTPSEQEQDTEADIPSKYNASGTTEASKVKSGQTFDDLVDRLVSPAMSEADHRFCTIFLCLYRKFASPSELLVAIWSRFEKLQQAKQPQLLKLSAQLHHLAILAQWLFEYPGDFAHPFMHLHMREFVDNVATNRVFGVVSSEMRLQLENVIDDDDTSWACSDATEGKIKTIGSYAHVMSLRAKISAILANTELQDSYWDPQVAHDLSNNERRVEGHAKTSSSSSSQDCTTFASSSSIWTPLTSVEAARRQTENLMPKPLVSLSKLQWHQFIEMQDEDIARELTRLDWILYCSIRPRDLIRHVSFDIEQRTRFKGLIYVDKMINHFNHVAFWAANMILLRDKAKHRAKALEKLMNIAWVS